MMDFMTLVSFVAEQSFTFVDKINNVQQFQMVLGMVVDNWTSAHGGNPHDILAELLDVSDKVNAEEGPAVWLA